MFSRHYFSMIVIMFLSGLLSAMYVWADKVSDVRISNNDIYMITLMTGWMLFFMTLFEDSTNTTWIVISLLFIIISIYGIRTQTFISKQQYFRGMIPHHSMAVHMSRQLLKREPNLTKREVEFINGIIKTQESEINWMKSL
jgi:hypothetical protein